VSWVDLNTLQNPTPGAAILAAWGDGVRDNDYDHSHQPWCRLSRAAALAVAVPDNNATAIPWDAPAAGFDTDVFWAAGNPTRITCARAGVYRISPLLTWAAGVGAGFRAAWVRVSGVTYISQPYDTAAAGFAASSGRMTEYPMAAGAYFEIMGFQTSGGGALNLAAATTLNYVTVTRVRELP